MTKSLKLVQTERKSKFTCIFLRCSLISGLQSRTKGTTSRAENKIISIIFYPEAQCTFCDKVTKISARRAKKQVRLQPLRASTFGSRTSRVLRQSLHFLRCSLICLSLTAGDINVLACVAGLKEMQAINASSTSCHFGYRVHVEASEWDVPVGRT